MFSFRTTPLEEQLDRSLRDGRVAVMEGPCSWDVQSGRYTSDIFRERGNLISISDWNDPAELRRANAIVVDEQDCGARYSEPLRAVISLMDTLNSMPISEDELGISLYIVDHPNPNGRAVEGSMPMVYEQRGVPGTVHRHGLTLGELARLYYSDIGGRYPLHVISLEAQANTRLVMPWMISPFDNMPGMFTSLMYPGMALWECTNITPGIGTTRPYEQFGAPFINTSDDEIPSPDGVSMRPCTFTPMQGLYAGQLCRGYQLLLLPGCQYHSLLHTVQLMRHFVERYSEFTIGADLARRVADPVIEAYLRGEISFDIVQESIKAEEQKWIRKAKRYVLYDEQPCRIK